VQENHQKHQKVSNTSFIDFLKEQPKNYQFTYLKKDGFTVDDIIGNFLIFPVETALEGFKSCIKEIISTDKKFELETLNVTKDQNKKGIKLHSRSDISINDLELLNGMHSLDFDLYNKSKANFQFNIGKLNTMLIC
jgi:hypothetical protein